jgi:Ala-tRNA(Pro) deacylase
MRIDETLYHGRADEGRLEKERRCYDLLDSLGIEYDRVDHEHADTIEACREVEKLLGCVICKNLFLTNRQQTEFYLLIMPGEKPFKTKYLSAQIGSSRLSFGGAGDMERLMDVTPGSVSLLGLMNDRQGAVRLLIDRELLDDETFGCHPCINSSSLRIPMRDVREKLLPALGHDPTYVNLPREIE